MCDFKDCEKHGKLPCSKLNEFIFQKPSCYGPLKAQTAPVAEVPCSDGLSAAQLIEPGYYWWLPQCERKNPDKQESWSIISWHPKIPDGRQGVFVGPLKKPSR